MHRQVSAAAIMVFALFLPSLRVLADDRDLLRESSSDPYVFILFDTSGSMHWAPQCTQQQFDDGICDYLCPLGDCFVPRSGDDPAAKLNQAKGALYEVIDQIEGINFGFATYNQDTLQMRDKHWLYYVSSTKPDGTANSLTLSNNDSFPDIARHCTQTGASCATSADCGANGGSCVYEDVFGATWPCDEGAIATEYGDNEKGCWPSSSQIADMNDPWEVRRAQRLPKLGREPDFSIIPSAEYRDNFNSDSFNNNDGYSTWSGGWIETDLFGGSGATLGNAKIENGQLRLDNHPSSFIQASLARQADLSGFTQAELSFDFEVVGDTEDIDQVDLEISSDGGSSWILLERFENLATPADLVTGSRTYDILSHASSNTQIRFRVNNQFLGHDEEFRVDNLEIDATVDGSVVYLRNNNDSRRYKFIYRSTPTLPSGVANNYGNAQFSVEIEVRECTDDVINSDCVSSFVDRDVIFYDLVGEYSSFDNGANRGPIQLGFFNQDATGDAQAGNTCSGWDGNSDVGSDKYPNSLGYNLRWATDPFPPPKRFDRDGDGVLEVDDFLFGDVIPLDWEDNHKTDILQRLAPNTVANPLATPDFGVGDYFSDQRLPGENFLRLKDDSQRPLVGYGSTPLGNSIRDFRMWYSTCPNCPANSGWSDTAVLFDRDFNCRKKFLMVLTDGDDTCGGASACTGTSSLLSQTGIKTFVVAFGVQDDGSSNTLTCMATNGGTGAPIYPQNKQELVDALLQLFTDIKVESRAFASASVPTVQNETSDKIYLSNFTPIPQTALWPGSVNAFRKPLPLKADNTPDFDRSCQTLNLQSGCHLWDASKLLSTQQAPTAAEAAAGTYRIGGTESERRILYGKNNAVGKAPGDLRLLLPPVVNSADEADLWAGLDLAITGAAARTKVVQVIEETVKVHEVTVPDPDGVDLHFSYVLGDIFHADPQVTGSPNNLNYFREDLHDYQQFSNDQFWRRKMLVVGANDGQLHFFDAGVRVVVRDPVLDVDVERFTDGVGKELFSYMPRLVMPIVREQAGGLNHIYSMDGAPVVADVHIDPHSDAENGDAVNPAHREWRTVLISGLREGGDVFRTSLPVGGFVSGYFALDITQPDPLVLPAVSGFPRPIPLPVGVSGSPPLVPGCMNFNGADLIGTTGCETAQGESHPFPAEMWSFTDSTLVDVDLDGVKETFYFDEDINTKRDLGDTWSKPVVGRIEICTGLICDPAANNNDIEERYVAIFGGGLDSQVPHNSRGSWLYIIDMETGSTLYKRQVQGAVPAAPAVLDIDKDGFFDVIYTATTLGKVYKTDLKALTSTGEVPGLSSLVIGSASLVAADPLKAVPASVTALRVTDSAWDPLMIFETAGQAIYMTPSAFLVPDLEQYALAFGTGNRQNLWDFDNQEGRFHIFVDEDYTLADASILPRTESAYQEVDLTTGNTVDSYLLDRLVHQRGWYIRLEPNEKVITQAFVLVGVLIFTAFDPTEALDLDSDGSVDSCARSGVSRAFVIDAENGNAFADLNTDGDIDRYHEEGDFTTAPYVDSSTSKNPGDSGKTSDSTLTAAQEALQESIRQALKRFFPKGCRYNKSYSLTVNASRSDTGHVRYATIPIAMCPVDWKEE